jgi:protein-tyrosine phosphatase
MWQGHDDELSRPCNFRDVGAPTARSGASVAPGRLFRSADISTMPAAVASRLLDGRGVCRVIDLRTAGEVSEAGAGHVPPSCDWVRCPLVEVIRPGWVTPGDPSPRATALRYMEMLEDGAPALLRIVRALGETPARPTVVQCVAGRDRTGIVIACVLDLLEVPHQLIAADYALSDGVLDDGGRAEPETIELLMGLIRRDHGSTRTMLSRRGMSVADDERLSKALLSAADMRV